MTLAVNPPRCGYLLSVAVSLMSVLAACSQSADFSGPTALNSRFAEHKPALSTNGRFLAFVSDRQGGQKIFLYNLSQQQFVSLPGLNQAHVLHESPSLSATGRYIVYITDNQGKPGIELYDRATRRTEALTRGYSGWVRHPSISPDGRFVAFETSREGSWDIEILDRGNQVELDGERASAP